MQSERHYISLSLWLCLYKVKRFSDISQESESYSASMSFGRAFPIMRNSHSRTLSLLLLQSEVIALVSAQGPNKTSPWHTVTGPCFPSNPFSHSTLFFSLSFPTSILFSSGLCYLVLILILVLQSWKLISAGVFCWISI